MLHQEESNLSSVSAPLACDTSRRRRYCQLLGMLRWERRRELTAHTEPVRTGTASIAAPVCAGSHTAHPESPVNVETVWQQLEQTVAQCQRCALSQTRTQTVFGVGHRQAALMIIGEAPGFYEDQQGEPFVGRAGQLLTAILQAICYRRAEVYIANILKCRPPNNRDPQAAEVATCTAFLDQQITLVKPRLLVAVGRIAAHYLLDTRAPLQSLRGRVHYYHRDHLPLVVTYHPAYLLRNPTDKRKAFVDWLFIRDSLVKLQAAGEVGGNSIESLV